MLDTGSGTHLTVAFVRGAADRDPGHILRTVIEAVVSLVGEEPRGSAGSVLGLSDASAAWLR